jgi:meromycolic acid enoyl-[acyl-carrier-protein] reductase
MLAGKRLLITGVLTRRSIALAAAREAQLAGAEVLLTGFGRSRRMTERAAARLPQPPPVLELDVNSEQDLEALTAEVEERWGGLDGALHAIAFAPEDAIGGRFLATPFDSAALAFRTSAYSLQAMARHLGPLLERGEGGSLVGLDFDAAVAWPSYDWMGVSKAALEAVSRYLARDLGPRGIRVNLVSAGPIASPAAGGIPGFNRLAGQWAARAPLSWDPGDPGAVAGAICFLFSEWSRSITGELIHVDGGAHAIGAPGEAEWAAGTVAEPAVAAR